MKTIIPILALFFCLFAACKKSDNNNVTPTPTPTPTNPYYFKFTYDGTAYNFAFAIPQYMFLSDDRAGGYQEADGFFPSIGLSFNYTHPVTNADVMNLAGKTFYYNSTNPRPELEFDRSSSGYTVYTIDTSNTNYNVKVTSVTYLKSDSVLGNAVDVYAIKGTCNGVFDNGSSASKSLLTNGDFNFVISRLK